MAGIVNTSRCLTANTERDLSRAPNKLETHVKHVHDTPTAQLEAKSRDIAQHEMRIKEELRMLTTEREKLNSERRRFDDEMRRVQELNRISDTRVRLNIGGHAYMTSTLTLTRDVDSMLAAMFSGRHALTQEADGSYFIDRDGTHFRYILNYLRDGGLRNDALPTDKGVLSELLAEAEFYQLSGLTKLLTEMIRKNDDGDNAGRGAATARSGVEQMHRHPPVTTSSWRPFPYGMTTAEAMLIEAVNMRKSELPKRLQ